MAGKSETLVIDIQINGATARRGLNDITKSLKKTESAVTKLKGNLQSLKGLIGGFGLAALAAGFVKSVSGALAFSEEIKNVADRVAFSTDALQELRFAASLVGIDMRQLDIGLQRFSRRVADAAAGSGELEKVFREQGIAIRDANGNFKESEQLLGEFADAVQNAGSEQEQLLLSFKAFDSEGAKIVNILKNGSKGLEEFRQSARDAGVVMDKELINRAAELNASYTTAITKITKQFRIFLVKLVDALTELPIVFKVVEGILIKAFARIVRDGQKMVEGLIGTFNILKAVITNLFDSAARSRAVDKAVNDSANAIKNLDREYNALSETIDNAIVEQIALSNAEKKANVERVKSNKVNATSTKQYSDISKSLAKSTEKLLTQQKTIGKTSDEVVRLNAELQRNRRETEINKLVNASPEQVGTLKALADAERDLTIAIARKTEQTLLAIEAETERLEIQEETLNTQTKQAANFRTAREELNGAIEAMGNQVAMLGATEEARIRNAAAIQAQADKEKLLQDLVAGNVGDKEFEELTKLINAKEQSTIATKKQTSEFKKQEAVIDSLQNKFNEFTTQTGDAIADFVTKGKADFGGLVESIINDLIRLQIQQQLTSAVSGGDNIFAKLFAGLSDAGNGTTTSTTPITQGIIGEPTLLARGGAIAGEAGPEAVLPLQRMAGGDLGVKAGGSGGAVTVNVINQADGATATTQERQGANGKRVIDVMIQSAVNKGITGGAFDKSLGGTFGVSRRGRS